MPPTKEKTIAINEELLGQLIAGYHKPEDLIGENGLLKQLTKRLIERAMQAEMTEHLGYAKNDPSGKNTGNSRNGIFKKRIKGDCGEIDIAIPRDRKSTFDPEIVSKGAARFKGFDDKIISMYVRGMTTREGVGDVGGGYSNTEPRPVINLTGNSHVASRAEPRSVGNLAVERH